MNKNQNFRMGMIYATLAFVGWGFFPIYWKFLKHVPLLQILSHRVIWAFVFYSLILIYKERRISIFKPDNKKKILTAAFASILLMSNWLVYIYAVNSNQIVESSLGYFINPLVNILIGVFFLKEKLSGFQISAFCFAALGVLIISLDQGRVPWIAVYLAISFSCYGLIKKYTEASGLKSNQFESLIIAPVALIYILTQSHAWLTPDNATVSVLFLVGSGLVTGLPLIFFAEATQKIPYYLMGFFQFIAPTMQFLSGILIFGEPLSILKLKGFLFIWLAGLILLLNSWWYYRHKDLVKI